MIASDHSLFMLRQYLPLAEVRDTQYDQIEWRTRGEDSKWRKTIFHNSAFIEILIPSYRFGSSEIFLVCRFVPSRCVCVFGSVKVLQAYRVFCQIDGQLLYLELFDVLFRVQIVEDGNEYVLQTDRSYLTRLLALIVDVIDTFLEDWYVLILFFV